MISKFVLFYTIPFSPHFFSSFLPFASQLLLPLVFVLFSLSFHAIRYLSWKWERNFCASLTKILGNSDCLTLLINISTSRSSHSHWFDKHWFGTIWLMEIFIFFDCFILKNVLGFAQENIKTCCPCFHFQAQIWPQYFEASAFNFAYFLS